MKVVAGAVDGEDRSSVSGILTAERTCGRLVGDGPRVSGRSEADNFFVSAPVSKATASREFRGGRNGLAEATMTREGAGAGVPVRRVAISMPSSLPSIGARATYSTRTRARPRP